MAWARYAVVLLIGLSFTATSTGGTVLPETTLPRHAHVAGVAALLPPKWEFRPVGETAAHKTGIQASADLAGWSPTDLRRPGLEAYWVDATEVGVPTDYYQLAVRGPLADMAHEAPGCSSETRRVAVRHPHRDALTWHYVVTESGTCVSRSSVTRWASFVAAPGYGPVRELGIPRSGLYVVTASVPAGPAAEDRLQRLVSGVSFGGTPVPVFLATAGLPAQLA
ncbi:MAG: hypothetical protein ACRDH8_03405 [Actinomycetota bacterium]